MGVGGWELEQSRAVFKLDGTISRHRQASHRPTERSTTSRDADASFLEFFSTYLLLPRISAGHDARDVEKKRNMLAIEVLK